MLRPSFSLVAWLACVGTGWSQTALAWKFQEGDAFDVEQRMVQATSLETKNKPFKQKSELTLQTRWQVKTADKRSAQMQVTVIALVSKTYAGDSTTGLASKEDDLWRGAEFSFTADPQGRVRELRGHEALLKKLAGDSPQRLKILTALKPPDYFQALFQDVLGPLPETPVRPGDQWRAGATDTMSIFGSLEQSTDFTYRGRRDGQDIVEGVTKSTYKAPRYAIENDVFRILKGAVKAEDGKAGFVFDAAKGRMVRVEKMMNLRGDLVLETLNGMQRIEFSSLTHVRIDVK